MRRRRSVRVVLLLGVYLLATCSGCLNGFFNGRRLEREDIEARDEDGLFPSVRVSFGLLPRRAPPRDALLVDAPALASPSATTPPASRPATPSAPPSVAAERTRPGAITGTSDDSAASPPRVARGQLALEIDYAAGIGGDDRQTNATGYVDFDGRRIPGAVTIQHNYDLHVATLGVRGGVRLFERVAIEGLGGLSVTALRFRMRAPGIRIQDTGVSMGTHVGARVTVTPFPAFDLFAQGRFHVLRGLQGRRRRISLGTAMVGGDLHLTPTLSLFGGWRWWHYVEDVSSESDFDDVRLSGPTFGALLRF